MEVLQQLIGRLHPLIVHLPIGFILLGLLLHWSDRKKNEFNQVVSLTYLWGGISAVLACITGYAHYLSEGYAYETVKWHLWSGIVTALFSFIMFARIKEMKFLGNLSNAPMGILSIIFLVLISFTGHQGGSITHGEDFLVEPLPNSLKSALGFETFETKKIALTSENWEEVQLYQGVIDPILNNNCVSCHNRKKRKGELLLTGKEGILEGGENGKVVIANDALKSEMFIRMNLPLKNEDHMPPDGKAQPSKEAIKLIGAWITVGHPFEGTIKEIGLEKNLFESFFPEVIDNDYPNLEIIAAPQDSIRAIKETGVHVDQITKASNFLKVSCINKPEFSDSDFNDLLSIREQIAELDLGSTQVTDAIFDKLTTLPNLTVLKLDHTAVTGSTIEQLKSLKHLKTINLTATQFDEENLKALSDFNALKKIFLFNTNIKPHGPQALREGQIHIEYGHYELPPIPSDSIVY